MRGRLIVWGPLALSAVLAACAAGPDYHVPSAPVPDRWTRAPLPAELPGERLPQRLVPAQSVPSDWWTLFGSTEVNRLVESALQHSPTVATAEASLRQAQAWAAAQRAALWPSAQASFTPQRGRTAEPLSSPLASGASLYTLHTAQLTVAYAPDVFGGMRRAEESAQAQAEVQACQLRAARLSVETNVVAAAVQAIGLREQLSVAAELRHIAERQLSLAQIQQRMGDTSVAATLQLQAQLEQARATEAALRRQLAQQNDLVAALTGTSPAELPPPSERLVDFRLPDLPLALPATVLAHRPDVQAALAQVRAANADVGVAAAALLPQIGVTADAGAAAATFRGLFGAGTAMWNLSANVAQTVFDAGANRERRRAVEAGLDVAVSQYRSAVLLAVQNVADTLEAARHDASAEEAARAQRTAAERLLRVAEQQHRLGDIALPGVLAAQAARWQAQNTEIQARVARLADAAAMVQAIGGPWAEGGTAEDDRNPHR